MKKKIFLVASAIIVVLTVCNFVVSTPDNELFAAVENRDLEAVKKALETVDINSTNSKGMTPIMRAAQIASKDQWSYAKAKNGLDIINYLIDSGADLSIEDNKGLTVVNYIHGDKKFTYWKIFDDAEQDKLLSYHWKIERRILEKCN